MSHYLKTGPLRDQWKAVYTPRKPKTGVSELLGEFDDKFKKYAKDNKFDEAVARRTLSESEAESAYSRVHGLGEQLKRIKPPLIGKWSTAETTFFHNLDAELKAASVVFTEIRMAKKFAK